MCESVGINEGLNEERTNGGVDSVCRMFGGLNLLLGAREHVVSFLWGLDISIMPISTQGDETGLEDSMKSL